MLYCLKIDFSYIYSDFDLIHHVQITSYSGVGMGGRKATQQSGNAQCFSGSGYTHVPSAQILRSHSHA